MDEGLLADISSEPPPADFRPPHIFRDWRDAKIQQIGDLLWPVYNPGNSAWQSPAVAKLFDADFDLLANLHSHLGLSIKGVFGTTVTHSDLFAEEDDEKVGFGCDYTRYDPTLPPLAEGQFRNILRAGYVNKVGTIPLQFKQKLQRPRPWQVAFIQGRSGYQYRVAASADTPSLISGHSIQGLMGVCNIFAELGHMMSKQSIEVLMQFAVDIGDRRVFAGVHYPSDNLSSWFTSSELVPYVFGPSRASDVKQFLRGAIEKKSVVYAAIRKHMASNPNSPYESIVEAIDLSSRSARSRRRLPRGG
jgi:hypothetical protein